VKCSFSKDFSCSVAHMSITHCKKCLIWYIYIKVFGDNDKKWCIVYTQPNGLNIHSMYHCKCINIHYVYMYTVYPDMYKAAFTVFTLHTQYFFFFSFFFFPFIRHITKNPIAYSIYGNHNRQNFVYGLKSVQWHTTTENYILITIVSVHTCFNGETSERIHFNVRGMEYTMSQ